MSEDVYGSFAAMSKVERPGRDYRIRVQLVPGSSTTIVAPHAGGIERQTSSIARAIARDDFNLYLFEGIKRSGNKSLHITSHRFNERKCLALVTKSKRVITIHGCKGRDHVIYLGGLDYPTKSRLAVGLRGEGFRIKTQFHQFIATHPKNICNRGATGAGVQLEFSHGLRQNGDLHLLALTIGRILRDPHEV